MSASINYHHPPPPTINQKTVALENKGRREAGTMSISFELLSWKKLLQDKSFPANPIESNSSLT